MKKISINLNEKQILVTGSAGFIGSYLVKRLLEEMHTGRIVGIDNLNDYYDTKLKDYRLSQLDYMHEGSKVDYCFLKGDISDNAFVSKLFEDNNFDIVVNLAAQAGVRYSIDHPDAYISSNIIGFYNIIEECKKHKVGHLVAASSSSVYGGNKKIPFSIEDRVDYPVSLYAATKKCDELLGYAYSKLYDIPTTMLRFFTVYGPAGRPDMFYYKATENLVARKKIQLFNYGNMKRDFTFIDDIVEGIFRVMQGPPDRSKGEDGLPTAPYSVYNIGGGTPENLIEFITVLQEELIRAEVLPRGFDFNEHCELLPMQPGDVPITYADSSALYNDFAFRPSVDIRSGLRQFAEWYKQYKSAYS